MGVATRSVREALLIIFGVYAMAHGALLVLWTNWDGWAATDFLIRSRQFGAASLLCLGLFSLLMSRRPYASSSSFWVLFLPVAGMGLLGLLAQRSAIFVPWRWALLLVYTTCAIAFAYFGQQPARGQEGSRAPSRNLRWLAGLFGVFMLLQSAIRILSPGALIAPSDPVNSLTTYTTQIRGLTDAGVGLAGWLLLYPRILAERLSIFLTLTVFQVVAIALWLSTEAAGPAWVGFLALSLHVLWAAGFGFWYMSESDLTGAARAESGQTDPSK